MKKIRKHISSIIAVILSLGIILSNVPFDVKAAETLDDYVTEGSYNYNIVPSAVCIIWFKNISVWKAVCRLSEINPLILNYVFS